MEAIVLAGGFGMRLRGVLSDVPKPMAPIGGKPFLEILLNLLSAKGFRRVVISLGYMGDSIRGHFGNRHAGLELAYASEAVPLGTGGGVRLAMEQTRSGHVFVFNGDTFLDLEVDAVESRWNENGRPLIVVRAVEDTARYGRIAVDGSRARRFGEKNASGPGLINAGSYVLKRGQLDAFAVNVPFSLEIDFLGPAVARGEFDVFETSGRFIDIGVPEDLRRAQHELARL